MTSRCGRYSLPSAALAFFQAARNAQALRWQRHSQGLRQGMRGSLCTKYIVVIVSLVVMLMGVVTWMQDQQQHEAMLEQARLRALALGNSLAALSEGYLRSYNFSKLEQIIENVVHHDDDIVYAIAHVRDGKVAAFSGRNEVQGTMLHDPISRRALQGKQPLVQTVSLPKTQEPGYDVAIPVYVEGNSQRWGTIRLGFSLKRAYATIAAHRRNLLLLGVLATSGSLGLAILLAARISRPVGQLVAAVGAMTRGAYDHPITIEARDEIGYLASAFEQMRQAVQGHVAGLAAEQARLQDANMRLKETQQQIVHLAARVAHDVNNPLAIIKTAIRIIDKHSQQDELARANLQMMTEEINRVARIIQELLSFSRPIQQHQRVDVNTVLANLHSVLDQNLRDKQISLKMVLEPEAPLVNLSPDHLKQVLFNLVRNAEDAMPDGGMLHIQTTHDLEEVHIQITDTGCGIAEEVLERLFDPFFTTKETERGMGLGLAVSFGIIRRANGNIFVESEVGKGTTFHITLPTQTRETPQDQQPGETPQKETSR